MEERPIFQRLLEAVFEKMQLAGEAGSLLKIEEEILTAIAEARTRWKAGPRLTQGLLFGGLSSTAAQDELDLSGVTDELFWERVEDRIYAALGEYAAQAESTGYSRRLFAEDAAKGFAFIEVCRKRYDAVVMNPPFGQLSVNIGSYVRERFLVENQEFYSCFITNASAQILSRGRLGVICGRPAFFAEGLEGWREKTLQNFYIAGFLDLGGGVLDAMVETCGSFWEKRLDVGAAHKVVTEFIRLNDSSDKAVALDEILFSHSDPRRFLRNSTFVELLPKRTFAYWLPTSFINWFLKRPSLEESGLKVFIGLQTDDDFRFSRLHWEVPRETLIRSSVLDATKNAGKNWKETFSRVAFQRRWATQLKGSEAYPFFVDFPMLVNWASSGTELKAFAAAKFGNYGKRIYNEDQFFEPGFSWSIRTDFFSPHIVPPGTIPTVSRYLAKSQSCASDRAIVAALNSALYEVLVRTRMGKWTQPLYMAGVIEGLPDLPGIHENTEPETLTQSVATEILSRIGEDETSNYFRYLPLGKTTSHSFIEFSEAVESSFVKAGTVSRHDILFSRQEVTAFNHGKKKLELPAFNELESTQAKISFVLGVCLGRWDMRYSTGEQAVPELPDPFAPLPVCPPGMLQNAAGLPAGPEDVPADYPIQIPWDGILVDDPEHPLDVECRVRAVLGCIWTGQNGAPTAAAIEAEACELLEVRSLREYFRKPAGFFADHLKRYSKSRRKAPIYWPLSTPSGGYTIWLYYHRLNDGTLYKVVEQFVEPKQAEVQATFQTLAAKESRSRAEDRELENAQTLLAELAAFRDDLLRLAKIWKPNLNDGVVITAAPLWRHFRLPAWQKELRTTWESLERGEYDWAHLAYTLWPARVTEKCKIDRSLAIAHNLEHLCTIEPPKPKKKRAKAKVEEEEEML